MPVSAMVWLGAVLVFGIIEGVTVSLTSIWFAIGALVAAFVAWAGGGIWLQVLLFLAASGISLGLMRPLAKSVVVGKKTRTNTDRVLGMTAKVTEEISNIDGTGAVFADGKHWTARSKTGEIIEKDTLVEVDALEGVKLIVVRKE